MVKSPYIKVTAMKLEYPSLSFTNLTEKNPLETLVLCVNNRYARRVLVQFNRLLNQSSKVMPIPSIMPQAAWLKHLAHELCFNEAHNFAAHLLDDFGARYLWQQAITEEEPDHYLLDVAQAARMAMDANRLISEWEITVDESEHTPDYQRFLIWQNNYRQRLNELNANDSVQTYEVIASAFKNSQVQLPFKTLVLNGFNELWPGLAGIVNSVQSLGVNVYILENPSVPATHVVRHVAKDSFLELEQAALWACNNLQQNGSGSYAIVVPDLPSNIAYIHRVLRNTLGPHQLVYNIAAARPLYQWPLVRAALLWLNLMAGFVQGKAVDSADIGAALLAGACAGGNKQANLRAKLDSYLRNNAIISLSQDQFTACLTEHIPDLAQAWSECIQIAESTDNQSIHIQLGIIRRLLQALGYPGNEQLDSHSWQSLEAFETLMNRLQGMSVAMGSLSFTEAVSLLEQLAQETPFQPQRDPAARLDVLGFLEAEGGQWDGVWVLGLTDKVLPSDAQPNPLIPWRALQRSGAPRSTPEREQEWAVNTLDALLKTSSYIWLSSPAQEGDQQLVASPLITQWPVHESACTNQTSHQSITLEHIIDSKGPGLLVNTVGTSGGNVPLRGGVGLLDTQAKNPLWAFVKYRLGASALPDYTMYTGGMVRGSFIHKCIELFWQTVTNFSTLEKHAKNNTLDVLIQESTLQAAQECLLTIGSHTLKELEIARAQLILKRWLATELQRTDFQVLYAEKQNTWQHAGVTLNIRIDRVDQLADGSLLIIDYKTGASVPAFANNWSRSRPVDIQLPLYASVLDDPPVNGLAFVNLHAKGVVASGMSNGDTGLAGVKHFADIKQYDGKAWPQLLNTWQQAMKNLIEEYIVGHAANVVFDVNDLSYCDVTPFLRLDEVYTNHV